MIEKITLLNLIFLSNHRDNKIKATASVSLDNIRISNLQIIQPRDGERPFLRWPSYKCYRDDGRFEYRKYLKLPGPLEQKINELVLGEYESQLLLKKTDSERDGRDR